MEVGGTILLVLAFVAISFTLCLVCMYVGKNIVKKKEHWPELHLARAQTLHCPSKREQCLTHSQECPPFQDAPFPTSPEGLQSVCKLSLISDQ